MRRYLVNVIWPMSAFARNVAFRDVSNSILDCAQPQVLQRLPPPRRNVDRTNRLLLKSTCKSLTGALLWDPLSGNDERCGSPAGRSTCHDERERSGHVPASLTKAYLAINGGPAVPSRRLLHTTKADKSRYNFLAINAKQAPARDCLELDVGAPFLEQKSGGGWTRTSVRG